mmetsp:Transcript_58604/g.130997  ORF Transcript_58604/g.130997 Transcript_58604/m.130997 type:complete len:215 (+) Transcript_58604:83-727(+)
MAALFCCCTSCDETKQDMVLPEGGKMGVSGKDLRRPYASALPDRPEYAEQVESSGPLLAPPAMMSHDERIPASTPGTDIRSANATDVGFVPPQPPIAAEQFAHKAGLQEVKADEPAATKDTPEQTMEVRIRKEGGKTLGIVLSGTTRDPTRAMIKVIRDDGLVAEWNRNHGPGQQIQTGTEVLNVNGRRDSQEMLKAVKEENDLLMVMTCPRPS